MANITGTLNASVTPTSTAVAIGEGTFYLFKAHAPDIAGISSATFVTQIGGTLNESITPSLIGAGQGANSGTLDASVRPTLTGTGTGNNKGTLDANIRPTLTGVGKILNGQLDASVTPTIVATGSVQHFTFGTLNESIAPSLVGAGNPWSSRLDALISLTLTGQGETLYGRLDEQITQLTSTAQGQTLIALSGANTLPALTISAQIDPGITAELTFPDLTISAASSVSNLITVDTTLPMLTLESNDGITVDETLPPLTSSASLLTGRTYRVNTTLPALTSAAQMDGDYSASADLTTPLLTIQASIFSGSGASVAATLPSLTILSQLAPGKLFDASLTLPALTGDATAFQELILEAALTLPALTSSAFIDNVDTLIVSTFSVNTENLEVTEYSNYDFLSMAMFNGKPVGVGAAGIYELSGGDDAGTNIDASALFGFDDLGTANMKRMFNAYLGYKSDGAVEVQISIDGEPAVRTYTVNKISGTTGIKRGRATIAKGLRSRYWQVGVKNVAGSDLELDTLDLYVHETKRKVQ